MYTIRCTRQLRARIPVGEAGLETRAGATTTRLGDWYAALHTQHRRPWVLLVSERSLLPILIPLAPAYNLPMRLLFAVTDRLRTLGISNRQVDREADAMSDGFAWGPTMRVTDSTNTMAFRSTTSASWTNGTSSPTNPQ